MDDPLSQALDEAPEVPCRQAPELVEQHTNPARPVHDILDAITEQVRDALSSPFFDGGTGNESTPIIKLGIAEAGNVHISAHHLDPPYHVDITLYVRNDLGPANEGQCQIRARCEITCDVCKPVPHRDFAIGLDISNNGSVTVDVAQLRREMAEAIRSIANALPAK